MSAIVPPAADIHALRQGVAGLVTRATPAGQADERPPSTKIIWPVM
jgi:hypothetical protein